MEEVGEVEEVERVVEGVEEWEGEDEQWVAPGESRRSFDGVVGHDQPYARSC